MPTQIPKLYKEYHIDRDYENLSLFEQLAKQYNCSSFLYPGCFVHITPSLVMPHGIYVDSFKKTEKFFNDPLLMKYIESRKKYGDKPSITFHLQSYEKPINIPEQSVDLLISQYAGFVSEATKKYLKKGGIFVTNNSHGDAGLANVDKDFELIAVANRRDSKFVISEEGLGGYFVPKKEFKQTRASLKKLGRGVGYTKSATNYIFRKVT